MYKLVIFDMDGVLLDSERLKALSYGKAINFLSAGDYSVEDVYKQFSEVVGSSREVVVDYLLTKFPLDIQTINKTVSSCEGVFSGSINKILSDTRMNIYREMLKTPSIVKDAKHNEIIQLLFWLKERGVKIGVATMSANQEAKELLSSLGVIEKLDFLLTSDSVTNPKPDPEIYLKASDNFKLEDVLVIEDSLTGIKAALAASLNVVVLLTDFTRDKVISNKVVKDELLFYSQGDLAEHVKRCITN